MLRGKKIILGICGSIAAYKSAFLVRLLVKEGAEVRVVLTKSASEFITPLTLGSLSKNSVLSSFTNNSEEGVWNNHVHLGLWADIMVVAPASANTIAKAANGFCDNLLTAVYLSARCPVFWAPAMDLDMYKHPAVLKNLKTLKNFGNYVIDAEYGELASGLTGEGRMAEPESIVKHLKNYFESQLLLRGKKVLITAGPTFEPIDPVRFIGNRSTGKMGIAVAETMARLGASVYLILGPTKERPENPNVEVTEACSAEDMYTEAKKHFGMADIVVFSAAVADYSPIVYSAGKIKKSNGTLDIQLTKTIDIAKAFGKVKKKHQFSVGFALETDNEIKHAEKKLKDKNFDFIVLNSLNDPGAGFGHDTNKITILENRGKITTYDLKPKKEAAEDIVHKILEKISL